ncbi:MAG: tyrosine recombinase XerC [Bacteroidia bacterium]
MLVNYRYAELSAIGQRWYVYYYVVNPASGILQRMRVYVDRQKSEANKKRLARKLIDTINNRLDEGWNPFIAEKDVKQYTPVLKALDFALTYKLSYLRERSKPNYRQRIRYLTEWLKKNNHDRKFIFEFSENMAIQLMNELMMSGKLEGRSYNNYLIDYRTFFNLLVKQKYIATNPFHAVGKIKERAKTKQPFTVDQQQRYSDYLKEHDYDFYIISGYCYYCALRPNEIVQLRVQDIVFEKQMFRVPPEIAKNDKVGLIPIADVFFNELVKYLASTPKHYLLCAKGCKPGTEKIYPTRIAEKFREIADILEFPPSVQFYGLKDTCADRLDENQFTIKTIRDLFRHSNIAVTDEYMKGINPRMDERLKTQFPKF